MAFDAVTGSLRLKRPKTLKICLLCLGLAGLVWLAAPGPIGAQEQTPPSAPESQEDPQILQKKYQAIKASYDQMKDERHTLIAEREQLMGQIKAHLKDRETLGNERDRLLGLVKKLNAKNEARRIELEEQGPRVEAFEARNEVLITQRDALLRQLEAARKRTKENRLKRQVTEGLKEIRQIQKKLTATRRAHRVLEKKSGSVRSELENTQGRLKSVEQEIVKLVSENDRLRREVNFTPRRVARLAKQHERLVRENADMHYNLGVLLSQKKLYKRATKEFLKVIELRPDDEDAHYNLGVIYAEHFPDRNKALAYFRRYLQLNPRTQESSWVKQYIATWQAWEIEERLE